MPNGFSSILSAVDIASAANLDEAYALIPGDEKSPAIDVTFMI